MKKDSKMEYKSFHVLLILGPTDPNWDTPFPMCLHSLPPALQSMSISRKCALFVTFYLLHETINAAVCVWNCAPLQQHFRHAKYSSPALHLINHIACTKLIYLHLLSPKTDFCSNLWIQVLKPKTCIYAFTLPFHWRWSLEPSVNIASTAFKI